MKRAGTRRETTKKAGESIKEEYEESSDDVSEVEGEEHYDE